LGEGIVVEHFLTLRIGLYRRVCVWPNMSAHISFHTFTDKR